MSMDEREMKQSSVPEFSERSTEGWSGLSERRARGDPSKVETLV
jgi:hypothetical protein